MWGELTKPKTMELESYQVSSGSMLVFSLSWLIIEFNSYGTRRTPLQGSMLIYTSLVTH